MNAVILAGIVAFFLSVWFLTAHAGFTVQFDTDGGSYVDSQKALYGETVTMPVTPVKEGFVFTGWYRDRARTQPWREDTDEVTESMTLYAGWRRR